EVVGLVADRYPAHPDGAVLQVAIQMTEPTEPVTREDDDAGVAMLEVEDLIAEPKGRVAAAGAPLARVDVQGIDLMRGRRGRGPARHHQEYGDAERATRQPCHPRHSYTFCMAGRLPGLLPLPAGASRSLKVSTRPGLAFAVPSPSPMATYVPRFSSQLVTPRSFARSPSFLW